jgi:hypothetical protein
MCFSPQADFVARAGVIGNAADASATFFVVASTSSCATHPLSLVVHDLVGGFVR